MQTRPDARGEGGHGANHQQANTARGKEIPLPKVEDDLGGPKMSETEWFLTNTWHFTKMHKVFKLGPPLDNAWQNLQT